MKIKRYQTGGIYYTPFFRDSVVQQESQQQVARGTTNSKEDNLIQKEIINVLKENGLPNDVDYFLSKANTFLSKSQNLGSLFGSITSPSYDMSDLIRIQSLANRIKHNNKLHEEASKQIISEGSGSEVAITNIGGLYVVGDEGVTTIGLNEYHKNPDKYRVLTNSELIRLREEQPDLAYNGTILTDLKNTVGMKSIVNYVKSTIGAFGTNKSSNQFDRYTSKQKGQIERGFEQLLGLSSPDGLYKVTGSNAQSDQGYSDEKSLEVAVNYLYRTLPENMKHVLKANAAAEGLNPSDPKDIQSLLTMAVIEHTNHSRDNKQSLDFGATATKASGRSGGSEKQGNLTREQMIIGGTTVEPITLNIRNSNSKASLRIFGQEYGRPEDTTKKQIGMGTIRDVMTKDPLGHNIDLASVSFGGKALNETEIDRVVYDGTSSLTRAILPIDKNEFANTGRLVPDFNATERFEEFMKWLDDGNGVMPNSIASKLRELNLDIYLGEDGQWHFNEERTFILLNGYGSDTIVNMDTEGGWVSKMDPDQADRIYDNYLRYINYGTDQPNKSLVKRANEKTGWFTSGKNHLYKGIIAMPLNDSGIATVTTGHEKVPQDRMIDILNRRSIDNTLNGIQTQF